jgi:hypothetical protein
MIVTATTPPDTLNFRVKLARDLPTWWNGDWGSRYHFPLGLFLDIYGDAAIYAVQARFPDLAPADAFVWFAQDRQIDRGFLEPLESYRARLKLWLDLWRRAGSAESVMIAIGSYIIPNTATMRTVSNDSAWDTVVAGASPPPVHVLARPRNWDWDSAPAYDATDPGYAAKWNRAWVIIYPPAALWKKTRTYGDGMRYGDGSCFGYTGNIDQTQSLRAQVNKWRPASTRVEWIILCFDPDPFHPEDAVSYPSTGILPDGRFKNWGLRTGDAYLPYRAIIGLSTAFGINAASYISVPNE